MHDGSPHSDPWTDPKSRSTLGFRNLHHRSMSHKWGLYFLDPPRGLGMEPLGKRQERWRQLAPWRAATLLRASPPGRRCHLLRGTSVARPKHGCCHKLEGSLFGGCGHKKSSTVWGLCLGPSFLLTLPYGGTRGQRLYPEWVLGPHSLKYLEPLGQILGAYSGIDLSLSLSICA